MGAFFFISTEMSAPGLGVPGFLGTRCLVAFFWAQYFDGNAEWFEILLFGIGIAFILMEVFVIPGFGIFGIGGILMVCAAIVLAAQSFLVPLNARDVEKLPNSLFPLAGAGFGILIAVLVLPRLIPDTPFLKNVILAPPKKPEATANLDYLMGQKGVAATKLMPSGRAQFGDQICDVITRGQVVEKGEAIEVIEAVANRVVVKKVSA
jgi:membrane-bound ClpP family serine protease